MPRSPGICLIVTKTQKKENSTMSQSDEGCVTISASNGVHHLQMMSVGWKEEMMWVGWKEEMMWLVSPGGPVMLRARPEKWRENESMHFGHTAAILWVAWEPRHSICTMRRELTDFRGTLVAVCTGMLTYHIYQAFIYSVGKLKILLLLLLLLLLLFRVQQPIENNHLPHVLFTADQPV